MRNFLAINVQTMGLYRMELLGGVQYAVVPVVALVEGVIQGITAEKPELALASEFGRFPQSWNGRPLTIDHPWIKDSQGNLVRVSASSSPDVLEEFQVGYIFNTQLKGSRLCMEAWIDVVKANTHSEEARELLRAI